MAREQKKAIKAVNIQNVETLGNIYFDLKKKVLKSGYSWEIDWQDEVSISDLTESDFLKEYAWVVLSSGMRESVIKNLFFPFSNAFQNWKSARMITAHESQCYHEAYRVFSNDRKIKAILTTSRKIEKEGFNSFRNSLDLYKIDFLKTLPFMGPATAYHLAKNIGIDVAKPDRHLVRIATLLGYESPNMMCQQLSEKIDEKQSVIDVVFWRYATLDNYYLDTITKFIKRL